MIAALLFDLDDTLVVEEAAAVATFDATARAAAARHDVDAARLAVGARARARELWHAAPTHPFCRSIGISSWEGMWCRFEGDGDELRGLRRWAPEYRREAWRRALADQGVRDDALAEELGERFGTERRSRHEVFADVPAALAAADVPLVLVTNGASCLQREKLAGSGLADHFEAVVVSGDLGTRKPDGSVFRHALSLVGAPASAAVMVGDNLVNDIEGAGATGLAAVWINRTGDPCPDGVTAISTLAELSSVL
jgi:putative hydrolase of the HAD superfamily